MITVMQGIPNVKLKSRAKAENVVRISEESLKNTEPNGRLCKKEHNVGNKMHTHRSLDAPKSVHAIHRFVKARARCGSLHGSLRRTAGRHTRTQWRRCDPLD